MEKVSELVDKFMDQKRLHRTEGPTGVRNLARVVNALGYRDFNQYGQMPGFCIGDIFAFLEDNPGAIETLVNWIREQKSPEWAESLGQKLTDN
jgi:hypothetical protein